LQGRLLFISKNKNKTDLLKWWINNKIIVRTLMENVATRMGIHLVAPNIMSSVRFAQNEAIAIAIKLYAVSR